MRQKEKGAERESRKEGKLDGEEEEEERRQGTREGEGRAGALERCFNKRSHVEKHSLSFTFSLSPSLSLHRTEEGRQGGKEK